MINPAVETDLVGDVIEVYEYAYDRATVSGKGALRGRGLCRAVTALPAGDMRLWLEVRDDNDKWSFGADTAVGDIVAMTVDSSSTRLRLVRST